jgi:hypothetical protein
MIVETRISQYRFAEMDEDTEHNLKEVSKRFARYMRFDFNFEYYTIYWEEQNWLLAKLAMPELTTLVTRV